MTPLSQVVGAAGVSVRWTLTLKNTIFSDSMIEIYYPKWNPSEGELAFSMVQSDIPNCFPVTNTIDTITCSYDYNSNVLTVAGAIESEIAGGTIIEFDVDSFQNPYSGKPRNGFWVRTTDFVGGIIDSSVTAKLVIEF